MALAVGLSIVCRRLILLVTPVTRHAHDLKIVSL